MNDIYDITGSFTFTNGFGETLLFNFHGNEKEIKDLVKEYLSHYQFIKEEDNIDEKLFEISEDMNNWNFDDFIVYGIKKNGEQIFRLNDELSLYIPDSTIQNTLKLPRLKYFLDINKTYVCSLKNKYVMNDIEEMSIEEVKEELGLDRYEDISDEEVYDLYFEDFAILEED